MADSRPQHRFRLPRFSAPSSRPATKPQPTSQSNAPAAPPPRPSFRPAGVAPAQPRASDQPSSSRASTQSQDTALPASSSRATGPQPVSQPAATPSRAASQPASPARSTAQPKSQLAPPPLPSQPTGPTTKPQSSPKKQDTSGEDSQLPAVSFNQPAARSKTLKSSSTPPQEQPKTKTPSPSKKHPTVQEKSQSPVVSDKQAPTIQEKSQSPAVSDKQAPTIQEKSQSPAVSDKQEPSVPQQEARKKEGPQPTSQEAQPKVGTSQELAEGSQLTRPTMKSIQSDATKPSQIPGPITSTAPAPAAVVTTGTEALNKNSESSTTGVYGKSLPEPERKLGEAKDGKAVQEGKTVPEAIKEGAKGSAHGEPQQKEIHELPKLFSGNGVEPKGHPLAHTISGEQQKQDHKELNEGKFEKKDMITTDPTIEKTVETVIPAYPKVSRPQQRPSMSTGERTRLQREIKEDVSKFMNNLDVTQAKKTLDEKQISIITLAGENRGASMVVGSESGRRDGFIQIHRGYKTNPDENTEVTDGEGTSRGRKDQATEAEEDLQTMAYMNSNVQSVNNSLVFNSSVSERDPGIHFSLSQNPTEPHLQGKETGTSEARKAEYIVTQAENLTYSPTIRRRCLRGLFVESSDSDVDNPKKPRRHGCHYGCKGKTKESNADIL